MHPERIWIALVIYTLLFLFVLRQAIRTGRHLPLSLTRHEWHKSPGQEFQELAEMLQKAESLGPFELAYIQTALSRIEGSGDKVMKAVATSMKQATAMIQEER